MIENENKYEIFQIPSQDHHVFIIETIDGMFDCIYCADLFRNGTIDHTSWTVIEEGELADEILGSHKKVYGEITVAEFESQACLMLG